MTKEELMSIKLTFRWFITVIIPVAFIIFCTSYPSFGFSKIVYINTNEALKNTKEWKGSWDRKGTHLYMLEKMWQVIYQIAEQNNVEIISDTSHRTGNIPDWTSLGTKAYDSIEAGFLVPLTPASLEKSTQKPERFELQRKLQKNNVAELLEIEKKLREQRERLEVERKKLEAAENRQRQRQEQVVEEPTPQSGTGSGFFVSKMGHVITNAHVVKGCKKLTVGDNANKQVPAEVINTDRSNDLALLKLSSLEMASAESKSLIQKLSIVVVPLASKGLLRSEDVKLGEKVLVAGYPFGDAFSNAIKVTSGIVSATRGAGDNSGQFQLDAAVQPGNSGGPIYGSGGNIVGVVVAQLNKKTFGGLVENINFGIKASTVRQFLISSGLSSKKADQKVEKSTEQLSQIAKNQALMVMCQQ
jgi:S1-C subfamily serine protease